MCGDDRRGARVAPTVPPTIRLPHDRLRQPDIDVVSICDFSRRISRGLKHFKLISVLALVLAGGLIAIGGGIYAIAMVVGTVIEHQTMEKCLTAHERQAKAYAAPDDYFGKQVREAATEEAKTCSELAARKEADKQAKK
jgi:hypothetical protein